MKSQTILPACLLLLLTQTALGQGATAGDPKITVKTVSDGIELHCGDGNTILNSDDVTVQKLEYGDDKTGEYRCVTKGEDTDLSKIYVKFRSCDNCIELDEESITGIVVGNVVATILIGVAVYLIASPTRITPNTTHKKSSDRQPLVQNKRSNRPSGPNDEHYQPLARGQKDLYDELHNRN
uniref:CD3 gamma/delta protein n=1 Tax=Dicentrarchus labrax TaxID=13489 RepID=G2XL95_DICLA|nr:CD3 gamma/delta protein [Dicentrarchus labrax]